MDFYETSACTNLNIKEVRTLGLPLCVWWDGEKQPQTGARIQWAAPPSHLAAPPTWALAGSLEAEMEMLA